MTAPTHPGIAICLHRLHDGEVDLERELHQVAERHHAEHEVHHVAIDLARWSLENRQSLASLAGRYGESLGRDQTPETPSAAAAVVREKATGLLRHPAQPGLLLIEDLRRLYLMAAGNSVHWTILGQAAQAAHDEQLLHIVTQCHAKTMRQTVWCNATIKAVSPQLVLAV